MINKVPIQPLYKSLKEEVLTMALKLICPDQVMYTGKSQSMAGSTNWGCLVVGVPTIRDLIFQVHIRALIFGNSHIIWL